MWLRRMQGDLIRSSFEDRPWRIEQIDPLLHERLLTMALTFVRDDSRLPGGVIGDRLAACSLVHPRCLCFSPRVRCVRVGHVPSMDSTGKEKGRHKWRPSKARASSCSTECRLKPAPHYFSSL